MTLKERFPSLYDSYFAPFYVLFKCLGCGMIQPGASQPPGYRIFNISAYCLFSLHVFLTMAGNYQIRDVRTKLYGISVVCVYFLMLLKIFPLAFRTGKVSSIMNILETEVWILSDERRFGQRATRMAYNLFKTYSKIVLFSFITYTAVAYRAASESELYATSDTNCTVCGSIPSIVPAYVPWEINTTVRYVLFQMYVMILSTYATIMLVSQDMFLVTIIIHIGVQFEHLQNFFENLYTNVHRYSDCCDYRESNERSIRAIKFYQLLIRCTQELQNVYGHSFIYQIMESSVPICLVLFLTASIINGQQEFRILELLSHASFLIIILYQLFIHTWYSNIVTDNALLVSDSIYKSEWFSLAPKARTPLVISMLRAQRPVVFLAAGFIPYSNRTFVEIVRQAYGIFALLINMQKYKLVTVPQET